MTIAPISPLTPAPLPVPTLTPTSISLSTPPPDLSPFDLPEIIAQIGVHLSRSNLAVALRVNQQWHKTLTPLLWRLSEFPTDWLYSYSPERYPSLDSVRKNRHHIRYLLCAEYSPLVKALLDPDPAHIYHPCKIQHLVLMILSSSLLPLIRNNANTLLSLRRRASVHQASRNIPQHWNFFQLISENTRLESLSLENIMIGDDQAIDPYFLETCARLSILHLNQCLWTVPASKPAVHHQQQQQQQQQLLEHPSNATSTSSSYPTFSNMKLLALIKTKDVSPFSELEFASSCPELEQFRWRPRLQFQESQVAAMQSLLSRMHHLTTLDITLASLSDEHIANLIRPLPSLVNFYARQTRFSNIAAQAIVESKSQLQRLDVQDSGEVSLKWSCAMMHACTDLVELAQGILQTEHITEAARQYPWRCTNLKKLHLSAVSTGSQSDRRTDHLVLYEQLSQLTELEELYVGTLTRVVPGDEDALSLSVEMGFGMLSTLKKMRKLVVGRQYADSKEVQAWCEQNWPHAEVVL
ncbi:hypothetical protein BG004_007132 [Podila humilis]|nr:hypothetical protein BG004_007132 [Podila humilis]